MVELKANNLNCNTTEAKIVATSRVAKESIWLSQLMSDLVIIKKILCLRLDNKAAIRLAENHEFHRQTNHSRVRFFFIREVVTSVS